MLVKLWIDSIRAPIDTSWVVVGSLEQLSDFLQKLKCLPNAIVFVQHSGDDCLALRSIKLLYQCVNKGIFIPSDFIFLVQSNSSLEKKNIESEIGQLIEYQKSLTSRLLRNQ